MQKLLVFVLSVMALSVHAQNVIKGKVLDSKTKTPLAGASIKVNGKSAMISDSLGNFSIDCSGKEAVTVSYVGYATAQKIIVDCNTVLDFSLTPVHQQLDNVEITATSNQNKSTLYQPVSIAKLTNTELKRNTGLYLDDAINSNVSGVTMQRRAVSSGQQFNIRGYGNGVRGTNGINSNFDGQGSKVYLNGIPITDAEGITVMDDIDFSSIGNVEITKGPAGTLYGLAIAGVVNLTTVRPEKNKTSIGQDIQFGSNGLQRFTTHFQTANEHSSLLLNYGKQKSDGYMVHTASQKDFVNVAAEFQPTEKQNISAYFGYSNSYDERGGELTIAQYNSFDYSGNPEYIKRNAHSEIISFRAGLAQTYNFNSHISNSTSVFASGASNNASSAGGWTDKNPINSGFRSTLDTRFNLKEGLSLSGITGIEMQQQYAQIIGYNMVANPSSATAYWNIGAMRSNQSTISSTSSLFTEWTLQMPKDVSITAGIGYSNMRIDLNDKFYVATNTSPTKFATSYNGMLSPHVAINKVINKSVSVYAAYSKGYKAPVSSYFFIPTTGKLNTDLRPEIGNQFEIGTKGVILNEKLAYQLAFFSAQFSDKMTAIAVPLNGSTTTAYSYIANSGKQDDKGIELSIKYNAYESATGFISAIKPFANLTYSDFKYVGYSFQTLSADKLTALVANYDGKVVAGVAPLTTNLGADIISKSGLYLNFTYSYKDAMPISSDGLNMTTSYNLLNAKLGIQNKISSKINFDLFIGATNITGTQYAYMVFVNQLPDAYLPAPYKINYFGGVNLKYTF
ncbi:MAG: TonB-dependent receptor [Bacteroidetes bacterium]|nr:TonB-dependent receptor [Bacteroidota bacterium]